MYRPDLGSIIVNNCYRRVLEPDDSDARHDSMRASQQTFQSLSTINRLIGGYPAFIAVSVLLPESTELRYRKDWQTELIEPSDEVQPTRPSDMENVLASPKWMKRHGVEDNDPVYIRACAPSPILSMKIV